MPVIVGQVQAVAVLHLRQAIAFAVVQGGGAQRRIAGQFIEQRVGLGWGLKGVGGQRRVGHQSTDGLQGLGRHAFLGDPVGGADKGQVGHQQHGGQQYQQGSQQFLPYR
ncbi:hypothetical protein QF045_004968 [Pseudomonas sp. W4I3]|nr:hypothetical protein [Pseudomonas sp. W4I3]